MNPRICWVFGLVCFVSSALSLRAANPDLVFAPQPKLSLVAWNELNREAGPTKIAMLHVQIAAVYGSINEVTVKEVQRCPRTAAEVQSWIQQQWKFVPSFSGTVVQPISFRILKANVFPAPILAKVASRKGAASLFLKSPKPPFPWRYKPEVKAYQIQNGYLPGVLLQITVREGAMVDIRVLDQKGPTELCDYMVEWVREHWQFRPNVSGSYRVPVYFELN
jgi:hypothetical protein